MKIFKALKEGKLDDVKRIATEDESSLTIRDQVSCRDV